MSEDLCLRTAELTALTLDPIDSCRCWLGGLLRLSADSCRLAGARSLLFRRSRFLSLCLWRCAEDFLADFLADLLSPPFDFDFFLDLPDLFRLLEPDREEDDEAEEADETELSDEERRRDLWLLLPAERLGDREHLDDEDEEDERRDELELLLRRLELCSLPSLTTMRLSTAAAAAAAVRALVFEADVLASPAALLVCIQAAGCCGQLMSEEAGATG